MDFVWNRVPSVPSLSTLRIACGLASHQELHQLSYIHRQDALATLANTIALAVAAFFLGTATGPIGMVVGSMAMGAMGSYVGLPALPIRWLPLQPHLWVRCGLPVGIALSAAVAFSGYYQFRQHMSWVNDPAVAARAETARFLKDIVSITAFVGSMVLFPYISLGPRLAGAFVVRQLLG